MERSQRAGGGRAQWVGIAGSLALHCAVAAALFGLPNPPEARDVSQTLMTVDLVELEPVLPPPGTAPPQPEPEPEPEPEPTRSPTRRTHRRTKPSKPSQAVGPRVPAGPEPRAPAGPAEIELRGLRRPSVPGNSAPPPVPRVRPPNGRAVPRGATDLRAPTLADVGFERGRKGGAVRDDPALPFVATIAPDGRLSYRHRRPSRFKYYHLKARIQRETQALRLQMARRWAKKQMRRQLAALGSQLRAVWGRPDPAVKRRRILFDLWEDCAEAPPEDLDGQDDDVVASALDRERGRAGDKARAHILAFIEAQLPEGSADAYPPTELRALNARRQSQRRFAPYARR